MTCALVWTEEFIIHPSKPLETPCYRQTSDKNLRSTQCCMVILNLKGPNNSSGISSFPNGNPRRETSRCMHVYIHQCTPLIFKHVTMMTEKPPLHLAPFHSLNTVWFCGRVLHIRKKPPNQRYVNTFLVTLLFVLMQGRGRNRSFLKCVAPLRAKIRETCFSETVFSYLKLLSPFLYPYDSLSGYNTAHYFAYPGLTYIVFWVLFGTSSAT